MAPFPGRQPGSLHDDGRAVFPYVGGGLTVVRERSEVRRGDAGSLHQRLRVTLAGFDASSRLRGTERGDAAALESVHQAGRERGLWSDHDQVDVLCGGPAGECLDVAGGNRDGFESRGHPPIRLCNEERGFGRISEELPSQRVLSATVSDDEDSHGPQSTVPGSKRERATR